MGEEWVLNSAIYIRSSICLYLTAKVNELMAIKEWKAGVKSGMWGGRVEVTREAHLFFELIHFLLKKPFHQFQFLFNFHHSFLHDRYQLLLASLKGRTEKGIIIGKSCHTGKKTLVIYFFPTRCLDKGQEMFAFGTRRVDFWWNGGSEHRGCTLGKKPYQRKNQRLKKKSYLCYHLPLR